jgi:isopenicillin-N N-acyltransferase-like protein
LNARGELSAGNPFGEPYAEAADDARKDQNANLSHRADSAQNGNGNPLQPQRGDGAEERSDADDGCSSFAILDEASGDGHVYCGQNWDWRSAIADTVVVLRIVQPGKPTIIMHAEAGQVGRQGANSAGIGLNANGLGTPIKTASRLGVPGCYIRRKVLDSADMFEALEAIFSVQQTFCTNLLLTIEMASPSTSRRPQRATAGCTRPTACWSTRTTSSPWCRRKSPKRIGHSRWIRCIGCLASNGSSGAHARPRRLKRCAS